MRLLAGDSRCVEFGLRRAQGPNGAMIASKYSFLGGFDGSSNVYAGYLSGIPVSGTQAHSFIMSFEKEEDIQNSRQLDGVDLLEKCLKYRAELGWSETNLGELYAFISFAFTYPSEFSSLIDTYSTLDSGIKNFLIVSLVLDDLGYKAQGIRLDSGDLSSLSKECRNLMGSVASKYGRDFSNLKIVASNDINEKILK
jgi:nicotinate phosphoribosyltransferase